MKREVEYSFVKENWGWWKPSTKIYLKRASENISEITVGCYATSVNGFEWAFANKSGNTGDRKSVV